MADTRYRSTVAVNNAARELQAHGQITALLNHTRAGSGVQWSGVKIRLIEHRQSDLRIYITLSNPIPPGEINGFDIELDPVQP